MQSYNTCDIKYTIGTDMRLSKEKTFITSCVHGLMFTLHIMKKHAFLKIPPDKPF